MSGVRSSELTTERRGCSDSTAEQSRSVLGEFDNACKWVHSQENFPSGPAMSTAVNLRGAELAMTNSLGPRTTYGIPEWLNVSRGTRCSSLFLDEPVFFSDRHSMSPKSRNETLGLFNITRMPDFVASFSESRGIVSICAPANRIPVSSDTVVRTVSSQRSAITNVHCTGKGRSLGYFAPRFNLNSALV